MDLVVYNGTPHWEGNIGNAAKESGITTSGLIWIKAHFNALMIQEVVLCMAWLQAKSQAKPNVMA